MYDIASEDVSPGLRERRVCCCGAVFEVLLERSCEEGVEGLLECGERGRELCEGGGRVRVCHLGLLARWVSVEWQGKESMLRLHAERRTLSRFITRRRAASSHPSYRAKQ